MDRQSLDHSDPADVVAVIFGASEFPRSEVLSASPAFARSARAFAEYLKGEHGFGLSDDQVLDLFDDDGTVIEQNDRLIQHLKRNGSATDLIVYYVGHGGFLPDREYFLALRSTSSGAEILTGLRIRVLAHTLDEHFPGKRIFLILDCCFAGEAVSQFQSTGLEEIIKNDTFDALPEAGTTLLCAASRNEPAIAPSGATFTMFSDCLLEVLRTGLEDERKRLSLAEIGEVVQRLIRRKFGQSGVRPEIHSPHQEKGDIARIPLFPNPAYTPPKPKTLPKEILEALRNPLAEVREGAVRPLARFLLSDDPAMADLARAELEALAANDDSRSVQQAARKALDAHAGPAPLPEPGPPEPEPEPGPQPVPEPGPNPRLPSTPVLIAITALVLLVIGAGIWWSMTGRDSAPSREKEIARLLSEADQDLRQGKIEGPEGDNAVSRYRAVLTLDPDNARARKSLDRIVDRFVALADEALGQRNLDRAGGFLSSAEGIAPDDRRVSEARARLESLAGESRDADAIRRDLAAAEADIEAGRLTGPKGNNAVERLRRVLARDPDNRAARDGLRRVVERLVTLTEDALNAGDMDKANAYLAQADGIAPGDEALRSLRARMQTAAGASKHSEEIERWLAEAEALFAKDHLTSPEDENAAKRYRDVLAVDPDNRAARDGLERVARRYVELADGAMADGKLRRADGYLAKAESVAPGNGAVADANTRLKGIRAKVAALTAAGDEAFRQDRLGPGDAPRGLSALETYRAASELEHPSPALEERLTRVRDRYLELGYAALESNDFAAAKAFEEKAGAMSHPKGAPMVKFREKLAATKLAFAVFPFEYLSVCHYSVRDEVTGAADKAIRNQPQARLAYSYYTSSDTKAIPPTKSLWSANVTHREPVLATVREAGRKLGVNGVFMAWYKCSHQQHVPADSYEVDIYLVDVDEDRIFHSKEKFLDVDRAVSRVFGEFFASRGLSPR